MKAFKSFLVVAFATICMDASAQSNWREISFQCLPTMSIPIDHADPYRPVDNYKGPGFSLSYGYAFTISPSIPIVIRPAVGAQYSMPKYSSEDNREHEWSYGSHSTTATMKLFSIIPTLDFGYSVSMSGCPVAILPYVGLTSRANLSGKVTILKEKINKIDTGTTPDDDSGNKDNGTEEAIINRFQYGWHAGADVQISHFIIGASYGWDISNFFDDKMSKGSFENIKLNGFSFKIGAMF